MRHTKYIIMLFIVLFLTACVAEQSLMISSESSKSNGRYVIVITEDGFKPSNLKVNTGEIIIFRNNASQAFVIGTNECKDMKSEIFSLGEEYLYVFKEPMNCEYIDGMQKHIGRIIVE